MNLKELLWAPKSNGDPFPLYASDHLLGLGIIILLLIMLVLNKETIKKDKRLRNCIQFLIAAVLILQQSLLYMWYVTSGNFTWGETLPLYTCRTAILFMILTLLTNNKRFFYIAYYWGLVGGIMALLTPDTSGFIFPHIMFVQFFFGHGGLLLAIVFMIAVHGFKPDKASLQGTIRFTLIYFIGVGLFNYIVGGNYCYLRHKPLTATPLDMLPAYPYYVPIWVGFFIISFYISYLPFSEKIQLKLQGRLKNSEKEMAE